MVGLEELMANIAQRLILATVESNFPTLGCKQFSLEANDFFYYFLNTFSDNDLFPRRHRQHRVRGCLDEFNKVHINDDLLIVKLC
jgi:hypothetical protein